MDIEIKGFTPLQMELADQIWTMDSLDSVNSFIDGLPRNLRAKARVVHAMLVAEVLDQVEDVDLAKSVLASFAK
jgi:hypothetical protein